MTTNVSEGVHWGFGVNISADGSSIGSGSGVFADISGGKVQFQDFDNILFQDGDNMLYN